DYWQQPITAEQLQTEMDRMAQHTKQPEVLRELFEALGNDPFVIAECLARPILAERLFTSALAYRDVSLPVNERSRSQQPDRPFTGFTLAKIPTAVNAEGTCLDAWSATSTVNAPSVRTDHTAVWTGSEMIVWGGWGGGTNYPNTGGKYNPSTDSWTGTSIVNAPSGRLRHTAVWTGSEIIIWGGGGTNGPSNTGGKYNPSMDSWLATTTANAPAGRYFQTAVWTGSEMIVWGGSGGVNNFSTGGRYNPTTDSWAATSTISAPDGRVTHTAVW